MAKRRMIGAAVMALCSAWLLLAQWVAAQDRPMHMRGTLAGVGWFGGRPIPSRH